MDNIFITGANGFLGSNLVKYFLNAGYDVITVIRAGGKQDNIANHKCQIIEYDGTIDSLQKYLNEHSIVIHTASYYVAEHKKEDLPILINSNLQYGLNLLEAMRNSGARKIINIGTAWQGYCGEERRAVNLYAATKQAFEDFIAYYCDAEGFSSISLRLNDTYGEEDKRMKLIKLLINAGVTKTPLNMSAGEQRINLSHISDVCAAVYASVENLPTENTLSVYSLLNKDEYSLRELVRLIESELGLTIPVKFGARSYRTREVMQPIRGHELENFTPRVSLREGIMRLFQSLNND